MENSGSPWLGNLAHQTAHARDWTEEMPYRISYIDTSMLTDEQMTEGIFRTEEFPTEPAALARARELLEDVDCKTVLVSDNSGEHLSVVGVPLKPGLTAPRGESPGNRLRCSS
jgi:hypothetical protein